MPEVQPLVVAIKRSCGGLKVVKNLEDSKGVLPVRMDDADLGGQMAFLHHTAVSVVLSIQRPRSAGGNGWFLLIPGSIPLMACSSHTFSVP